MNTLPVPLAEWRKDNWPDDSMRWSKSAARQIYFLETLERATYFSVDLKDEQLRDLLQPRVVSTHLSKSIKLPVVEYATKTGATFLVRGNFYNWVVSVELPYPIEVDLHDLPLSEECHPTCCEGFPTERIYKTFVENQQRFTAGIYTEYELFTLMWTTTRCAAAQSR